MKQTSATYGTALQQRQLAKYRGRDRNHWGWRIDVARRLLGGQEPGSCLDVGCSIGTFAIELAKDGWDSYGVDFDPEAIAVARLLAEEEGVRATFVCGDVAAWDPPVELDVALCMDIFEHLHDDELGALLSAVRRRLRPGGRLIFHTHPQQYDYLFAGGELPKRVQRVLFAQSIAMLAPLSWLPPALFSLWTRCVALLVDAELLVTTGKTYREHIVKARHCNPLTRDRLERMPRRAGYEVELIETTTRQRARFHGLFADQPVAHRNLYGVAVVPAPA